MAAVTPSKKSLSQKEELAALRRKLSDLRQEYAALAVFLEKLKLDRCVECPHRERKE